MIKTIKANIPNAITCLNLLSGCLACIFSFRSTELFGSLYGYELVFIFIAAAAVFDFCDGAAARLLHAYSLLGKELDSLSDLVSFGLAPALLVFNTMKEFDPTSALCYGALLLAVCGALRLAKFNIDERQSTSFIGLPIPANALFWIGFCGWVHSTNIYCSWMMLTLAVVLSYTMVSRLKMFSLKFSNFRLRENWKRYIIIVAALALVICCGIPGLAWTILLYIAMSIVWPTREK